MTVSAEQKRIIRELAHHCCEYCRLEEDELAAKFQIDHIIPKKHAGEDTIENLSLACLKCNQFKGANVAALDPETREAMKLFNPREQVWDDHFSIRDDATLIGLSPEGRATIFVMRINDDVRVAQRALLMSIGEYPCR